MERWIGYPATILPITLTILGEAQKTQLVSCPWKAPNTQGDCKYSCLRGVQCHIIKRLGI